MGRRPAGQSTGRARSMNRHINFSREGAKSNARKVPTEVRCIKCRRLFVLPFRPRKPEVYCDTCFKKKGKATPSQIKHQKNN